MGSPPPLSPVAPSPASLAVRLGLSWKEVCAWGRSWGSWLEHAQRCSLQVEGCRRRGGRGLSAGSGPCGLRGMAGSEVHLPVPGTLSLGFPGPEPEPEERSCPSTPTPGTLASNARTFTPALHAAVKETEAQRAEGMAGTTQHVLGRASGQCSPALLREQLSGSAG